MDSLFRKIEGHLQDMQADTKANARDLRNLVKRTDHMDKTIQGLLGTFASIEQMLREDRQRISAVETRLEALERKQPPAA